MKKSQRQLIEGYQAIEKELEICRKYGIDYSSRRGQWMAAVERLHPRRLKLKVAAIISETADASTLRLVAAEGYLPPFQAGQYINLLVDIDGIRTGRPYSISSPPSQTAYYDLTVRRVPNGFVSDYLLDRVKPGDLLDSTGPAGHLYYNPLFHGRDLVFLAGGSGITPFASMIRDVTDRCLNRRIHLIYGCRTPDEAIFNAEFLNRAKIFDNFTYDLVISDPNDNCQGLSGLLDAELIKARVGDVLSKTFYLCGPQAMYEFCVPELNKLNILRRRIRQEIFGTPARITQEAGWPQEVSEEAVFSVKLSSGREIPARACEPLLISLERAGIVVENCCRSGECSLCRVKMLSGRVYQTENTLLRKSDKNAGYIHSCAAYPLSDLEILL
ncbi:MAG TPA: FAD-binding oxidoreductase [Syntrophomonadaceae bacterium]|nr:FAD-binding oxidoreductase [Syntrophomonadaceae bacterium]HPR94298.1 FAD-binding oxidoreductase [Syntrophomonadaceae bacterium]